MKLFNNIKIYSGILIMSMCCSVMSCDYLDVVPPEQAELPDATKDAEATLGFLYSCYAGIRNPISYTESEASTDEFALPELWNHRSHLVAFDQNLPNSPDHRWGSLYRFIGQSHLFLQQLKNAYGITEAQRIEWAAEANFLIAYYHFEVLRFYGPCPITDSYIAMDTPSSEYPGRSHYDYVTDWICNRLDEAAKDLPATRSSSEWGRTTSTICKAIKAKALLYAASPLWNGSFPYPEWKNKNYETPGYGKELVSHTYDREKWNRALTACKEALEYAQSDGGCSLYTDEELYAKENVPLPFIPGLENESAEGIAFRKKVLLMRYLATTRSNEGNKELVWGLDNVGDNIWMASLPTRVLKLNNGNWYSGYSGVSPFLNTIERFYTNTGKLPSKDNAYTPKSEWLKSANVNGRPDIIKINIGREPRFYAWMAFDGGDYSSKLADGKPLKLQLRNSQLQGFNPSLFNRDHCVTGFLSQKWIRPNLNLSVNNSWNFKNSPRPLIRLAELYLNIAECYAALDQKQEALSYLNPIRQRAGVPALKESDVTNDMPIMEWVINERFIEFWGEGQRYFDIRRWGKGAEYLAAGKREGLNAEAKLDPTFNEYNQRVKVSQPYKWENRMNLGSVFYNEVYKNPQMIQAPGY